MNTLLPLEYSPQTPDEFCGPAQKIARIVEKSAAMSLPRGVPAAFLFYGEPGVGKSQLAKFTMKAFGVVTSSFFEYGNVKTPWNMTVKNGTDLSVDAVRAIAEEMRSGSMFGSYRGYLFDECDMSKRDGQARFLTLADYQPTRTVIAATCNSHIEQLDERFQRRFQVFEVKGPDIEQMVPLISRWLPEADARAYCKEAAEGREKRINAGALLRDVTTVLQMD